MQTFQTITQFIGTDDNEYNDKKYNKNACHFFALKTAYEFMKKKECSKTTHEANIYFAINLNKLYQNQDMFFDEILNFTNLKISNINATTTELIKSGEYLIDYIFPTVTKSYCVIILKNGKYFTILHHNGNFYVRDCHEPFQYDFTSKNDMINHINLFYQFNETIVLDGYTVSDFSSIEYIIIENPFEFKDGVLEIGNIIPEKKLKETKFGISIGHLDYENCGNDIINLPKGNIFNLNSAPSSPNYDSDDNYPEVIPELINDDILLDNKEY